MGGTEKSRIVPVHEKKSLLTFQKNFFKNFSAKHTKGLKPFRAHFGYRKVQNINN